MARALLNLCMTLPPPVNLGVSNVTVREFIELSVGDVITLDRGKNDNLNLFIEDARKFEVRPVERSGYLAAEIVNEVEIRLPPDMRQIAELDDVEEDEIDD